MFNPSLWNVDAAILCPVSAEIRSFISDAEAFVNDNTKISCGRHLPVLSRYLILPTTVVVFPVPAPAITKWLCAALTIHVICCWSSFRPSTSPIRAYAACTFMLAARSLCLRIWCDMERAISTNSSCFSDSILYLAAFFSRKILCASESANIPLFLLLHSVSVLGSTNTCGAENIDLASHRASSIREIKSLQASFRSWTFFWCWSMIVWINPIFPPILWWGVQPRIYRQYRNQDIHKYAKVLT